MIRMFTRKRLSAALAMMLLLPTLLTACKSDKPDMPEDTTPPTSQGTAAPKDETDSATDLSDETEPETAPDSGTDEETTPPEEPPVQLTGPYADSIMYADATQNKIQVYFANQNTRDVIIENPQMKMILNTLTTGEKQVTSLQNSRGGVYVQNTMDVFIRTTEGETYFASDSPAAGRLNIYRYGYYYYNTHILDQIFSGEGYANERDLRVDRLKRTSMKNDVEFLDAEEGCKFRVTATTDPYAGFENLNVPAASFNAVEIVMRAEQASVADLFLGIGSHMWPNSDQHVSFSVTPGSEFLTYVVPISGVVDYTGKINSIRLDIGSAVGEIIEVKSMRLVQIDESIPSISLDRTLHAYADKLMQETHLVTTGEVANLAAYGMKTEISADTVNAILVKDAKGLHSSLDGVDFATLEYIGFDIKGTGVFGYIKTLDYGGTVTVTLKDGVYTLIQEIAAESGKALKKDTHLYMGTGLYTDSTHTFDAFTAAAEAERHPLTLTVTNQLDGGTFKGYNSLAGAYEISINGTPGFQYNYENDIRRTLTFKVTGDKTDRKVYIYTSAATGETLESAVLLDENNRILPIPVEVCKNFGHEKEEPVFVPNDDRWGEAWFPFVVEADKENTLSVINLYQDWGKYPLKQISSISFNAPYYHLSTGATESNCIANYFIAFMANNLLPDFRGMSQRFWTTQPQHTAAGVLNFFSYKDSSGTLNTLRHEKDEIVAYGPTYADLMMDFNSIDEKVDVTLNHIEMPQTDENRTYYTYTLKVLEDVTVSDFKNDVTLFTMTSSNTTYKKLGYLDESGKPAVTDTAKDATLRYITLGKESPYYDLFVGDPNVHEDGYSNLSAIFKSYDITVNGKKYDGNLVLRESLVGGKNRADITLDLGAITLNAGDTMTFHMILMPWGEGQDSGISETDDIVRRVRMDSCIDPFKIEASVGTVMPHEFVPQVKSDGGKAEFTVSGGHDTAVFYEGERDNKIKVRGITVRVYGFDKVGVPVVEEKVNGKWVAVDLASKYGYDGYMIHYDGDGTYSYSFVIDMTEPNARTFRVTLNTDETIFADINLNTGESGTGTPDPTDEIVIDGISYTIACINSLPTMAFDTVFKDTQNTLYQPKEGSATAYLSSNPITLDETWKCFQLRGWAGHADGKIVSYGYRINDGEMISDASFVKPAEEGVIQAGGQSRFTIIIPIEDITMNHLIRTYIILEDGTSLEMTRFWALGAEEGK